MKKGRKGKCERKEGRKLGGKEERRKEGSKIGKNEERKERKMRKEGRKEVGREGRKKEAKEGKIIGREKQED
jgi:hypothetical protein